MEEFSIEDPTQLLQTASDFANDPGFQNEDSVKQFFDQFPLPVILNALQTKADVPGLENVLVTCLERVFKTRYGASLIPHYMSFLQVGLKADSQPVRCLACKAVSCLIKNINEKNVNAAQLIVEHDLYPLLLDCLINGNEQAAAASMDVIQDLACTPNGMAIIFPANNNEVTHLKSLAARCSSLGRVRILALIVKLFSISNSVASAIYNSSLLGLMETEVSYLNDTLVALSVLELFYELAEVQHANEFLSRTKLLQLLCSIISNTSVDSIMRTRAMMITGRILSKENVFMFITDLSVKSLITVIGERLESMENQDKDECESALEALGQIGSSTHGAELLLVSSPLAARHVVNAAFDQHARGKQLAALHSLGNITGETRVENEVVLNNDAEDSLRCIVYEAASKSFKLTPSGLFLSVLQQESELRLAGYRVLTGLSARAWGLMEICSKQEIIKIVTDALAETTKIGMEVRYNCCKAIHKNLMSSNNISSDPALAEISSKLLKAINRGPYLATKHREAQPEVMTAERF